MARRPGTIQDYTQHLCSTCGCCSVGRMGICVGGCGPRGGRSTHDKLWRMEHGDAPQQRTAPLTEAQGPGSTTDAPTACAGRFYDGVTPERPTCWHLFFSARPALPAELRGTTKSGKPKKQPPRLPPNINERRAMHPMVERKTVAFWRDRVPMEVRRQHGMRRLEHARISAVIYRRNLGVADGSGDAERLKCLVDGLIDAGVLPNDRRSEVTYGAVEEQHPNHRGEGVLLIVEEI